MPHRAPTRRQWLRAAAGGLGSLLAGGRSRAAAPPAAAPAPGDAVGTNWAGNVS
jgi:hypothetical protein